MTLNKHLNVFIHFHPALVSKFHGIAITAQARARRIPSTEASESERRMPRCCRESRMRYSLRDAADATRS
jgi:hypothetical protein